MTPPPLVSIGYEGKTLDRFIDDLVAADVDVLVDVRLTPISRKPGFSKTRLSAALAEAGIEYRHHRELGNPKENRDAFRAGKESAWTFYKDVLSSAADCIDSLVATATDKVVALLCYEQEHKECHRSCITDRVLEASADPKLLVTI